MPLLHLSIKLYHMPKGIEPTQRGFNLKHYIYTQSFPTSIPLRPLNLAYILRSIFLSHSVTTLPL